MRMCPVCGRAYPSSQHRCWYCLVRLKNYETPEMYCMGYVALTVLLVALALLIAHCVH